MGGCRILGARGISRDTPLWVSVWLPDSPDPLAMELAWVQLVRGREFGLKKAAMAPEDRKRLRRFLEEQYQQRARARQAFRKYERQGTKPVQDPRMPWRADMPAQDLHADLGEVVAQDRTLGAPQPASVPPRSRSVSSWFSRTGWRWCNGHSRTAILLRQRASSAPRGSGRGLAVYAIHSRAV